MKIIQLFFVLAVLQKNMLSLQNKLIALEDDKEVEYDCIIIEDKDNVDKIFKQLKKIKAIPFFIPRKNKIIVKYQIN